MKTTFLALTAVAATVTAIAPASAAPWMPIPQREANLNHRIEVGMRDGTLTRGEARNLHARFVNITRLEDRYRASNGLSNWERRDLDQRFMALSSSIRYERHDDQNRRGR